MRVRFPEPAFARLYPPVTLPPTVRFPALTVIVGLVVSETFPDPRSRFPFVAAKLKLEAHVWELLLVRVFALPLVLSIVPPLMISVPLPMDPLLLITKVPVLSVVEPL